MWDYPVQGRAKGQTGLRRDVMPDRVVRGRIQLFQNPTDLLLAPITRPPSRFLYERIHIGRLLLLAGSKKKPGHRCPGCGGVRVSPLLQERSSASHDISGLLGRETCFVGTPLILDSSCRFHDSM